MKQNDKPDPKHNPTSEERDEKVSLYGVDPESALAALLKVDPNADPDDSPEQPNDEA